METTLKKLNKKEHELTIRVVEEELKEYLSQAENAITQETQIEGFRKGKVPKDLVRKKVGNEYILKVALDIALKDSLAKAIQKDKIDVLKTSKLEIKENTNECLLYKVNLVLFPDIKVGELDGIKIVKEKVDVTNDEINGAIEVVRLSRASFAQKDGPAEKGDRVEVDFEVMLDGETLQDGISKNHPLVIGESNFIPGFEDNIIGAQKGDNKSFSIVAPKNYSRKELANKKLDFKLKINAVQRVIKPELDEEFARSLGDFSNLDELKSNVKDGIKQDKENKERQRVRIEILAKIDERSETHIPDEYIEERIDNMISKFDQDLHRKGMELSLYLAHINKTQDDLRKDWRKEAEKQVRYSMIIRKLAKDKNIVVAPNELEQAVAQRVQTMTMAGQFDNKIDLNVLRETVFSELITEKTLSLIESNCSI